MDTKPKKKTPVKSKKTEVQPINQELDEFKELLKIYKKEGTLSKATPPVVTSSDISVGPPVAGHTLKTTKDIKAFFGHDEFTNFDDGSFDSDVTQKQPSHGARKPMFPRTVDGMKFEKWGGVAIGVEWIDECIRGLWKEIEEDPTPQCIYRMTGDKMVMLYYTEEGEIMIAVNKVLGMFQCDHSKLRKSINKTNPKDISLESKRIKDMDIE